MGTQVFKINPDGTTTQIETEGAIKEVLKTEECYVVVADEYRKVYLCNIFSPRSSRRPRRICINHNNAFLCVLCVLVVYLSF